MKARLYLAAMVLIVLAAPVFAQEAAMTPKTTGEVTNLEANFPTQLVDTQTVPQGTLEVGLALGYANFKSEFLINDVYGYAIPMVAYGIMPNLEVFFNMPTTLFEGKSNVNIGVAGNTDISANFDTDWGLFWRVNEETQYLPSFGIALSAKAPTGYGATGWDGTALGVITKSFGPVRLNVNASITTIGKANFNRVGMDHLDSYTVGLAFPAADNVVLIADVYSSENPWVSWRSQRIDVAEIGARYALTDKDIISAGFGFGLGGGIFTPDYTMTVGYQRVL